MTDKPKAAKALQGLLAGTRGDEMDCDEFLERLAPFLDGRIDDPALRDRLLHHASQCPECAEEVAIVKKALGLT
jgi:hypothetical protein